MILDLHRVPLFDWIMSCYTIYLAVETIEASYIVSETVDLFYTICLDFLEIPIKELILVSSVRPDVPG